MGSGVKFIRVHGKVVPIRDKAEPRVTKKQLGKDEGSLAQQMKAKGNTRRTGERIATGAAFVAAGAGFLRGGLGGLIGGAVGAAALYHGGNYAAKKYANSKHRKNLNEAWDKHDRTANKYNDQQAGKKKTGLK